METGIKDKRVIITGPESTGKSDLSVFLAKSLNGVSVPEYARDYIADLGREYTCSDIEFIAKEQYNTWKKYEQTSTFVFFDTHLIITKVWFLWIYKKYPAWIDDAIKETSSGLYLLCNYDLPWQPDPLRENGGEARIKLFYLYQQELNNFKINYKLISGVGESRPESAITLVRKYFELT